MNEISLQLDERNLAHVLSALALCGISKAGGEARCFWKEDAFVLRIPLTQEELFDAADTFLRSIKWTAGIGCGDEKKRTIKASPHHGVFSADGGCFGNPLISLHDQGATSSVFKTFSGQKGPEDILQKQMHALKRPDVEPDWLFQRAQGVASWKLDARTGGHAYSQGFSANEDGSGERSPFYPAIELLALAGTAFFASPLAWLLDEKTLEYSIWGEPLPPTLAPLAATGLLDGVGASCYRLSTSGNSYGKGAAYCHFPEATPAPRKSSAL